MNDEEDTANVSADNALEADRESNFTYIKKPGGNEPLDDDLPTAPAESHEGLVTEDHPKLDTNVDPHELYDEGIDGAQDAS